jgi:hypothetical protein
MQKKFLLLFCLVMGTQSLTAHDLNFDLAGTWKFVITKSDNKDCLGANELVFVPSPFTTPSGKALFMIQGSLCGQALWGASIEELGTQKHLVWYELEGQRFDVESNMILSSTSTDLSLGGDFEEYEVATMTKIAELEE